MPNGELAVELVRGPERGDPGFPLTDPVLVRVVDGDGSPQAGIEVSFEASDGGKVEPETATSGLDGLTAVQWTLGAMSGPGQFLSARVLARPALLIPVDAPTFQVSAVDAGDRFACGLADGDVWCWNALRRPFPWISGKGAATMALSQSHVCALDQPGSVWCRSVLSGWEPEATQVAGLPPMNTIAAGDGWHCGVSANDRSPWCWSPGNLTPFQPSASLRLLQVSVGRFFACGLDEAGAAWCWGQGNHGQLGTDDPSSAVPVPVSGGLRFRELGAGGSTACGIVGTTAVYCWGWLGGLSTALQRSSQPVRVAVTGVDISLGTRGGLASGSGQTVQWGGSIFLSFQEPTLLRSLAGLERLSLKAIAAGESMCGIADDDTAWCSRDVLGGSFFSPGPLWVPVPAPDTHSALRSTHRVPGIGSAE